MNAYKRGRTLAVVVLYGEDSDWVRNVLAGGGQVVRMGRTYDLLDPRLIRPGDPERISPRRAGARAGVAEAARGRALGPGAGIRARAGDDVREGSTAAGVFRGNGP